MSDSSQTQKRMTLEMWAHRGLHPEVRKWILDDAKLQLLTCNNDRSWQVTNYHGLEAHANNVIDTLYKGIMDGSLIKRPIFKPAVIKKLTEETKWSGVPEELEVSEGCHQPAVLKRAIEFLTEVFRNTDLCLAKDLVMGKDDYDEKLSNLVWGPKGQAACWARALEASIIEVNEDFCGADGIPKAMFQGKVADKLDVWDLNDVDSHEVLGEAVAGLHHLLLSIISLRQESRLEPHPGMEAARRLMEREAVLSFIRSNLTDADFTFLSDRIRTCPDELSATDSSKKNPDLMKSLLGELKGRTVL